MNSLLFLVPLSLVLSGIGIGFFLWAVRAGQFEDFEKHQRAPLDDED
jgi:cbb3-type cytochrome oxidase maturation protein